MRPIDRPHVARVCGFRFGVQISALLVITGLLVPRLAAQAWEHVGSKVQFIEYREGIVEQLQEAQRPYFLLFSAEWCHWCHEFGDNTLANDTVADYLNAHYTSVFIDADVHSAAYLKYRATGLPFSVFLNPDASPQFRYAGTLYADDFLTVIKQIKMNVAQGLSVEGNDKSDFAYEPPAKIVLADLQAAGDVYRRGVLESIDPLQNGLGKREKAVYPNTFLYLLSNAKGKVPEAAVKAVQDTLIRAVEHIYDPLEGGFFRYAETRDWQIPHYEKMADLNAGTVLLLYRLNEIAPVPRLVEAADKTLSYLRTTLYDAKLGVFLSFQEADTRYYAANSSEQRGKLRSPAVIEKVFIDRLAQTISHLLGVLDYRHDALLEQQLGRALDFITQSIGRTGGLNRYYTLSTGEWTGSGTLEDYALVARMFLHAAERLASSDYRQLARKTVNEAIEQFYDGNLGVLMDPSLGDTDDAEFLMQVNGLIAQTLIGLEADVNDARLVKAIITYFSAMGDVFDQRLWDGENWAFTERYVPYLRVVDRYLNGPMLATEQ